MRLCLNLFYFVSFDDDAKECDEDDDDRSNVVIQYGIRFVHIQHIFIRYSILFFFHCKHFYSHSTLVVSLFSSVLIALCADLFAPMLRSTSLECDSSFVSA